MLDWIRTSEEKISVSRDALSIEHSGKFKERESSCSSVQQHESERDSIVLLFNPQMVTMLL